MKKIICAPGTLNKKKLPVIRIIRRIVQTASFILLPGLFISVFSAIQNITTALATGAFQLAAQAGDLLVLLAVIPVTMLMGRFFCGFLCSFGSMGDFLWYISRKLFKKQIKISASAERGLKLIKYALLLFLVFVVWIFGLVTPSSTTSPWTIFGMYASVTGWPSAVYLLSIGAGLLLLIMAGSMLVERFFCRYLCPLGATLAGLSRFRLFRISKPRQNCGSCRLCSAKCPMGIELGRADTVTSGECIDCFACTSVCPRGNAKANPAPALAASLSVIAMTGLYTVGSLASDSSVLALSNNTIPITDSATQGQYTDGVYTGTGYGFKGTTQVEVTISGGNITAIQILSTGDDAEFFVRAKSSVISSILAAQSAQVDTVSGATFSSDGIIGAVADALSSAGGGTVATSTPATAEVTTSTTPAATTAFLEGSYADGVYAGSGSGFRGTTTVSVSVSGGKITDITVTAYQDDYEYFVMAESSVIADILSQQSVSVDTVSGATFSSNGIMEAVANALGVSYTNNNSQLPSGGHGGRR